MQKSIWNGSEDRVKQAATTTHIAVTLCEDREVEACDETTCGENPTGTTNTCIRAIYRMNVIMCADWD
jgi:hypothetical protein